MALNKRGVTVMETVIVIVVSVVLASAFGAVMVPTINFFFYYPESSRVNQAAADVVGIIIEGDEKAKGLRYAGEPCDLPSGGQSTITAASTTSLTYHYSLADECGNGGTSDHDVTITYNAGNQQVTRAIDGAAAIPLPYYATTTSGIEINAPGGGTNFFHYYDAAGTDLGGAPVVANIMRVDINVLATSGAGTVTSSSGQILLKSGVEIKRHTT